MKAIDSGAGTERRPVAQNPWHVPSWKGNLLVFGLLILMVLAYFYWQSLQAQQTFLRHMRTHSRMLAGVIERNAESALLAQEVSEAIMGTFLGNMARFVDYLESVEPFTAPELGSFALEAGLAGITIVRPGAPITQGPADWLPSKKAHCRQVQRKLHHLAAAHLYFWVQPRSGGQGCILLGITAQRIETLREQVSLPQLMEALSALPGIREVRLESEKGENASPDPGILDILLETEPDRQVARTRVPFGQGQLVVSLEARHFFFRIRQLWQEFFIFSLILALTGVVFSWILHRYQRRYLLQVRGFERELARQHEDAALGRAAASITHEIRNPLNAISMGLQRIRAEAKGLDPESLNLVETMLRAVTRTDGIIKDIRQYARPPAPRRQTVRPRDILFRVLDLYRGEFRKQSIEIQTDIRYTDTVMADPDMVAAVTENLVKNALEAQPAGGYLNLRVQRRGEWLEIRTENSGFSPPEGGTARILEPYFTTKTRGTGLGLAIARRIMEAHGGQLVPESPEPGVLRIHLFLPLSKERP